MNKYNVFLISKLDEGTFLKKNYNHTYGSLTRIGVLQLLQNIPEYSHKGIFYDMGCGNGELILNMLPHSKFKKYIGIELSTDRIIDFVKRQKRNKIKTNLVEPICKDLLLHDYSDASVIYISNLCFPDHLNRSIGKLLDKQLKEGKNIIVFSSKNIYLTLSHKKKIFYVKQSWSDKSEIIAHHID